MKNVGQLIDVNGFVDVSYFDYDSSSSYGVQWIAGTMPVAIDRPGATDCCLDDEHRRNHRTGRCVFRAARRYILNVKFSLAGNE